jgi:tetratricopeptide (TPR) repeat protein
MLFMMVVTGCTLATTGARSPNRILVPDPQDRPVNAYFLFSEAHVNLRKGNLDGAIENMQQALILDPGSVYLRRELAGFWLMKKDTAAALALLNDVLASHPDDIESLILMGRINQNINQPKAAMDAYSQVIALDPGQQNVYLQLGGMYMEQEQWPQAKQVYEQLVKNFPGAYAGYFFLGRISAINGDRKSARAYFEKTLALEPELVESRFELGALYEADKKYKKAASVYSDILEQDPTNVQAQLALGYAYHQQGMKKKAQSIFISLGRMSAEDQSIVRILVRDYLDARNFEAADTIIQGMLKGETGSSDLNYLAGVALDGLGKKDAAIDQLKQVEPGSRFFQNAAVHAALLYQEMEQIQAAIDFLLATIEKDPQNPEFFLYLGSFYEQVEAYQKAEKALKDGLDLDLKNPRLYFRLGVVYDKWGRKEDSIAAMRQVLRFEPTNANALNYLGYTYADMGSNLDEAEQLIRKALDQKPGDGYITDSLAWVYYKRGQYDKALPILEQAASLVPDDPIVQEHLGDVYSKLGMIEKALQSYRRSIENGHSDKAAVEKKIRLLAP